MSPAGQMALLLAAVLVQAAWPLALRPAGVVPDLTLVVVIGTAVATRSALPIVWALVGGTLLDVLSALPAGTNVLGLAAAAALAWVVTAGPLRGQP
jgi:rod shape-determining protein MreD